jgi:23S rRNA-/tRNA-specific pseudouridylate synthase
MSVVSSNAEDSRSGRSLIQAEPMSGRTHQIRVHCSAEGFPIIGDPFYWDESEEAFDPRGIRLTSFAVRFFHPYRRELMTFEVAEALKARWLKEFEDKYGAISIQYRERSTYEGS